MKKFVTLVFTFLLFTLLTPAFAQTTHQIYVHDIQSNKIIYQTGENVQGTFTISNLGTTAQSDIYYVISSGNYIEKTFTMVNDINPSDKIGPIYVKSQSKDKINFSYTLPQSISGNIAVQITALLKDGTLVGQGRLPLVVEGKPNKNLAYVENPFLMISNFKDIISPDAGPTVYKGETISYNFSISPTTKTYIIKPVLKIYNRAENKDSLKKTIELDPIKTDLKSTFHEFLLPVDLDPLVYYGVISFESNDVEIPSQSLRYIISGPIATIRNITADKLEVSKGDEFAVTVSYGGQPADEFRPEKQIAPPSATITLSATNENGEVIGESTQPLNLKDANKNLNIPIISKVSAKVISFKSAIKDASGKILSEYSTTLPTKASVSGQESYIKRNATPLVTILIVIILLIAVIVILVMRKKHKFIHVPLAFFAIAMILIASVSAVKNVKAWEIIYKAGALFTVNAVVSPLPPEIKSYNPGERFNLSVSMLTSDCNNEPWYAYTYASRGTTLPASDSEWKLLDTDTANIVISGSATLSGWQKNKINSYIWGLQEPAYTSIPETNLRRSLRAKYLEKKAEDPSIANISGVFAKLSNYSYILNGFYFDSPTFTAKMTNDPEVQSIMSQLRGLMNGNVGGGEEIATTLAEGAFAINTGGYITHSTFYYTSLYNNIYTAPTTPGLYNVYFKAVGSGNGSPSANTTISATICVRGSTVCGEQTDVGSTTVVASIGDIASTSARVNWVYQDTKSKPQTNYNVQVATDANFTTDVQTKVGVNGTTGVVKSNLFNIFKTANADVDVSSVRSVVMDGLTPNTKYYVRMKANNGEVWSAWSETSFTTTASSTNPNTPPEDPNLGSAGCGVSTISKGVAGLLVDSTNLCITGQSLVVGSFTTRTPSSIDRVVWSWRCKDSTNVLSQCHAQCATGLTYFGEINTCSDTGVGGDKCPNLAGIQTETDPIFTVVNCIVPFLSLSLKFDKPYADESTLKCSNSWTTTVTPASVAGSDYTKCTLDGASVPTNQNSYKTTLGQHTLTCQTKVLGENNSVLLSNPISKIFNCSRVPKTGEI